MHTGAEGARCWRVCKRVIPWRPLPRDSYRNCLSTYQIRCALRALNEAALRATIWITLGAPPIFTGMFLYPMHIESL